jgi:glycosyltransferase involved in cell wall biosynthesis
MKKLLIEGWRGINHSYAMVNQHQILALARCADIKLHHRDVPFFMSNWNVLSNGAGFSQVDADFISGLQDIHNEQVDFSYRISAPIPPPSSLKIPALTSIATEFGLDDASFSLPASALLAYTAEQNLVVTPSRWSRDRLLDYGFAEEGVRVVSHGVDRNVFKPILDVTRDQMRKDFGFKAEQTVFLNVGAPIWNKGMDLLLEAYGCVHQKNPLTRLIIKDGSALYGLSIDATMKTFYAQHPDLATASFVSSIMVVPSNLSQLQLSQLYGISDYYVSPYRAEGFNLPVLEAMACGVPVIVTSGGSTDDFCEGMAVSRIPSALRRGVLGNNKNSCWLEPHVPALVELMRKATENSAIRLELSNAASEQSAYFTWDRVATRLMDLFGIGKKKNIIEENIASIISSSTRAQAFSSRKRTIQIYCDGGFGNRFNGLISGLIIADETGMTPVVVWPRNNWCGAAFADIFENEFSIVERELISFVPEKENFHFLMTEDHLKMGVTYKSPLHFLAHSDLVSYVNSDNRDIYFHTPLIPTNLPLDKVIQKIRELRIQPHILKEAEYFIWENDLLDFDGVHIRKTDFGSNGVDEDDIYKMITRSKEKKYFICSDDANVEKKFKDIPNAYIYPKKAYVEKKQDGDWNQITLDHSGRAYPCNVDRSAQSVIDAVVDWLILSDSNIIETSGSTFLRSASLRKMALGEN